MTDSFQASRSARRELAGVGKDGRTDVVAQVWLLTARYLVRCGPKVVGRTWGRDRGEIGIVARDDPRQVVAQVRVRQSLGWAVPAGAATTLRAARGPRLRPSRFAVAP